MIPLLSRAQIDTIARAGRVVDEALAACTRAAIAGATPTSLAAICDVVLASHGATSPLRGYRATDTGAADASTSPFPASICVCVNACAVHGVPNATPLLPGDIVTLDIAAAVDGWHADAAHTIVVGEEREAHGQARCLAHAAQDCVDLAVACCIAGARWREIARAVCERAQHLGCCLIEGFNGHGIGAQLHQPPVVSFPSTLARLEALPDFELFPGMVLCIEPVITLGSVPPTLVVGEDRWSVLTRTRQIAAFEERCVAITRSGPRILAGHRA